MLLHERFGVRERALRNTRDFECGKITFAEWVRRDGALWAGQRLSDMLACLDDNPLRSGARELLAWFTTRSVPCIAISSGLSNFNRCFLEEFGFREVICNELVFEGSVFSGRCRVNVGEHEKGRIFNERLQHYNIAPHDVVVFGDGTADIPMLQQAGLGVAVLPANEHARAAADLVIDSEPIHEVIPAIARHFNVL